MTTTRLRFVAALVILGALMLSIGTLVYFPMPSGNREILSTLTGALVLLARDATRWLFPPASSRQEDPPQ